MLCCTPMRYMGIDYGSKRVGVALSDDGGRMAFPHTVVQNDASLVKNLEDIALHEGVKKIVIGHSLDREGNKNAIHEDVQELIGDLTLAVGLPIELEPEHYTTQEAKRIQGKNGMTDASAAAIILNSYLTRMNQKTT